MVDGDLIAFTKRAKDMIAAVTKGNRVRFVNFLNDSEAETLSGMVGNNPEIDIVFSGGFNGAQRQRAALIPSFMRNPQVDIPISVYQIEVIGSGEVTHSQVLGSLMGLDIDRNLIGDIVIGQDGAFFATCSEFDKFLIESFTKVGRHDIKLNLVETEVEHVQQFENVEVIVSSMRLDVVVKALMQSSRRSAEEYLQMGYVRLNHVIEKRVSRPCNVGDLLSIRKVGRFKIVENKKTTKSGKSVLVVSKSV